MFSSFEGLIAARKRSVFEGKDVFRLGSRSL